MSAITPDAYFVSILDIDPRSLADKGYRAVLLDVDNTLLPRGSQQVEPEVVQWLADVKRAGLDVVLLSNCSGDRAEETAEALGLPVVSSAFKPLSRGYIRACAMLGVAPKDALMIGDQSYTDVFGAHRLGMDAYMVMPQNENEPFHTFALRLLDRRAVRGMRAQGSLR